MLTSKDAIIGVFLNLEIVNVMVFYTKIVMTLVLINYVLKIISFRTARFKLALLIMVLLWNQNNLGIIMITIWHLCSDKYKLIDFWNFDFFYSVLIVIWSHSTNSSAACSVKTQPTNWYSIWELTTMNVSMWKWRRSWKSSTISTTTTSQDWSCTTAAALSVMSSSPFRLSDLCVNGTSVHHQFTHVPSVLVRFVFCVCNFL